MSATTQPWDRVEAALADAKGICFDGCHKIYVLLDEEQVAKFEGCGYDVLLVADLGSEKAMELLRDWYENSCGLRFIQSVATVDGGVDPNEGYARLIAQFEDA